MQADDELVEQSFGIGGLTVTCIYDATDLSLLNVAKCKFRSPGLIEIFFFGRCVGDELGDEADRVGVFVFGETSHTVGKIEAFHQAQKDSVKSCWIASIRWTRWVSP